MCFSADCTEGFYPDPADNSTCIEVPIGTYKEITGSAIYIECPFGFSTVMNGSTDPTDCHGELKNKKIFLTISDCNGNNHCITNFILQLSVQLDLNQMPQTQQNVYCVKLDTTVQSMLQIHVKCVQTTTQRHLLEAQVKLIAKVSFDIL